VRLEWISAAEGDKLKQVMIDMVGKVKALGPLGMPEKFKDWDEEMEALEGRVSAQAGPEVAHAH
jgi:hypothetical protein